MGSLLPSQIDRKEQLLFSQALDQFSSSNRLELLKQLRDDYPDSPWGRRAETIILYAQELDNRKEQLVALRDQYEHLKQEKEQLTALSDENELLKQDNIRLRQETQQLIEKIEQLKGLLIELENRPQ